MCQRCAINQKSLRLAFVHRDLPPTDNNLLSQTGDDESICILKSKYRSIVEKLPKAHTHTRTTTNTLLFLYANVNVKSFLASNETEADYSSPWCPEVRNVLAC